MFGKLAALFGKGGQDAVRRILPSAGFRESIVKANNEWIEHCVRAPLFYRGTKVHLLGNSLVNLPPAADVRRVVPQLNDPLGWLCVDFDEFDAEWLNRYSAILKQCPVGEPADGSGMEPYLASVRTWAERGIRGRMLDEGVAEEWVDALVFTGLRPGADVIDAVEYGQEEQLPVEFIGLGSAEEVQRIEVYLASRSLEQPPEQGKDKLPLSPPGATDLEADLHALFQSVGVSRGDIALIDSGSPLVDSRLQNLVLGPSALREYDQRVTRHLGTTIGAGPTSRPSHERWRRSRARKHVRCEHIVERLQDVCEEFEAHTGRDQCVLAVVDRNSIHGVREMMKALEE
ncbi:hypothetical protein HKX48_003262 [Thoreauomyces humboldtii]|nr:hypothetical protein HKX48_003262 [Thoreauomyces humboldtii]